MFVTAVLRNIGRGVTRLSPSCYAQLIEYLHHANKTWDICYAPPAPLHKERTPRE